MQTSDIRDAKQIRDIGRVIDRWGVAAGSHSRRPELPWRSTRDPWAILVSEVMAQQTQLARVVPAYLRFVAAFPTPDVCASSPLGEVLRAWHGLGYNRRARNLHRTATAIVSDHAGEVPSGLAELLALPGVGPYTARAVLAFAFERDIGVIDTNAGRVLSRAVAGRTLRPSEAQVVVDGMVPDGHGWRFGQALLDLGATVCVSGDPACELCPIRRRCRWRISGKIGQDPARGSAGVSKLQSRFGGSNRQGRGRLVDELRKGSVQPGGVAAAAGWPDDPERAASIVAGLIEEGLVARGYEGVLRLPGV